MNFIACVFSFLKSYFQLVLHRAFPVVTFMVSIICNFGSSNFFYISEQKEHKELIPLVRTSASPATIHCHTSNHVSSLHKRKLRSLSLNPVNEQLFVTR